MADVIAMGEKYEKEADKKIHRWLGPKYKDAAKLYDSAAKFYNLPYAWEKAATVYLKLAGCHLILDSKHEAASAYADAANKYKEISVEGVDVLFAFIVNEFDSKEIGQLYEGGLHIQKSIFYFEQAAEYFYSAGVSIPRCECLEKVAQLLLNWISKYTDAIKLYEDAPKTFLNDNLLKYRVKDYLLSAGLCHFHKDDIGAVSYAVEQYKEMDPTFSGTRECKFLADLVASVGEENVQGFTNVVKEFHSRIRQDAWKITLLLRVKQNLKHKRLSPSLEKVAQHSAEHEQ
ncbi:hypothetical protein MKW92_032250 [Papaver armeniacum]|nr:hypothetical protein MKW92_032250 [Papaver armeniacum]